MCGGVGIGLVLVCEFIELYGGEIWGESKLGGGVSFSVWLFKGCEHFDFGVLDCCMYSTDKLQGKRVSDVGLVGWDLGFEGCYCFIDIDQVIEKCVVECDVDEG